MSDTLQQRVWAAPLRHNLLFLALFAATIWAAMYIWYFPEERLTQPGSPWAALFRWAGAIIFAVSAGLSGLCAIHRGRLVLDRDERSLRFYYILFWPRAGRQLRLDEIVALNVRALTVRGDDDNEPWTYRIAVAELRDGRLVSIAFDSTPGISEAIRDAVGPQQSVAADARPRTPPNAGG